MGMPLLILLASIVIGDLIGYANEKADTREGRRIYIPLLELDI